jgi:hypothetical protein
LFCVQQTELGCIVGRVHDQMRVIASEAILLLKDERHTDYAQRYATAGVQTDVSSPLVDGINFSPGEAA